MLVFFAAAAGVFSAFHPAYAGVREWAFEIIGHILVFLISIVGGLLTLVTYILLKAISYNRFIYTQIVTVGWQVVRDISNIFFIIILIVVAIGTVISSENYHYKRSLPRILLMAILINFSKTICGIFIDLAQVVMYQFSSVLAGTADTPGVGAQQIFLSFGIQRLFVLKEMKINGESAELFNIIAGLGVGLIFLVITLIVITIYLVIFVMRIVTLWILIVLSPLAFLLSAWPGGKGKGYAQDWWKKFFDYVSIGPILLFFLWLALVTAGKELELRVQTDPAGTQGFTGSFLNEITNPDNLSRFVVTVCLLLAGLYAARRSGVAGAGLASSALQNVKRTGLGALRKGTGYGYVADRVKAYRDIRRSEKNQAARLSALKIAETVDKGKRAAAKVATAPIRWGTGFVGEHFAKQNRDKAEDLRGEAKLVQRNFEKKEGFKMGGIQYSYDAKGKKWQEDDGVFKKDIDAPHLEEKIKTHTVGLEERAKKHSEKAREHEKRQRTFDKYFSGKGMIPGLGVLAGAASFLTGGLAAGIPLLVTGVAALLNRKGARDWGKSDVNSASSYQSREVRQKRDELRDSNHEEIREKAIDPTQDAFTRMAAILEGIKQGIFTLSEVEEHRKTVAELSGDDKKLMARLEAEIEEKYSGGTKLFAEYEAATREKNTEKREKARRGIVDNYADGTWEMRSQDSETIEKAAPMIADAMKKSAVVNWHKGTTFSQQKAFERGAKGASFEDPTNKKVKAALADVVDVSVAYGAKKDGAGNIIGYESEENEESEEWLENYLRDLSQEDLKEIANKRPDRLKEFKLALDHLSRTKRKKKEEFFSDSVKKILESDRGPAKSLRTALELGDAPKKGRAASPPDEEDEEEEEEEEI